MESDISETKTQKKMPKSFSIESIIGANSSESRKSPLIDIENNDSTISEEDESENRVEDANRMRYYFNSPFLQNGGNFPFLLGYEPWLPRLTRMLGSVPYSEPNLETGSKSDELDPKRDSPVSVGSEIDSDIGEDIIQGM